MQFSFYFGTDLTDLPQPPLHRITAPLQVVGAIVGAHCGKALRGGFMRWRWGATKLRRVRRCLLLTGRLALTSAADRLTCSFARWRRGAANIVGGESDEEIAAIRWQTTASTRTGFVTRTFIADHSV